MGTFADIANVDTVYRLPTEENKLPFSVSSVFRIYIYIHIHIIHIYTYVYTYTYTYMHKHLRYVHIHICMYTHMHIFCTVGAESLCRGTFAVDLRRLKMSQEPNFLAGSCLVIVECGKIAK